MPSLSLSRPLRRLVLGGPGLLLAACGGGGSTGSSLPTPQALSYMSAQPLGTAGTNYAVLTATDASTSSATGTITLADGTVLTYQNNFGTNPTTTTITDPANYIVYSDLGPDTGSGETGTGAAQICLSGVSQYNLFTLSTGTPTQVPSGSILAELNGKTFKLYRDCAAQGITLAFTSSGATLSDGTNTQTLSGTDVGDLFSVTGKTLNAPPLGTSRLAHMVAFKVTATGGTTYYYLSEVGTEGASDYLAGWVEQ